MANIIELPNGQSAVLKDVSELTNREVKTLRKSARIASSVALGLERAGFEDDNPESWKLIAEMDDDDYDTLDLFQRTCAIIRLKSWTLDLPMPKEADEIDDLPMNIYGPLVAAAADINLTEDFTVAGANDPLVATVDSDD